VKVGEQGIHHAEAKTGADEQVRGPANGWSVVTPGGCRAPAVSSTRTLVVPTAITRRRSARARLMASAVGAGSSPVLTVHMVGGDILFLHRTESVHADVQCDKGELDASLLQTLDELRGKVQSSRRRRHGALHPRIDRLVTLRIGERVWI